MKISRSWLAALVLVAWSPVYRASTVGTCSLSEGMDVLLGTAEHTVSGTGNMTRLECCNWCASLEGCIVAVFGPAHGNCWPLTGHSGIEADAGRDLLFPPGPPVTEDFAEAGETVVTTTMDSGVVLKTPAPGYRATSAANDTTFCSKSIDVDFTIFSPPAIAVGIEGFMHVSSRCLTVWRNLETNETIGGVTATATQVDENGQTINKTEIISGTIQWEGYVVERWNCNATEVVCLESMEVYQPVKRARSAVTACGTVLKLQRVQPIELS